MKPGIYYNMSREEYDAIDAVNPSMVKVALESIDDLRRHDAGIRSETSAAMELGSAVDAALTDFEKFEQTYKPWSGNRVGDKYDKACADNPDVTYMTLAAHRTAILIYEAVMSHKLAREYTEYESQVCVVWDETIQTADGFELIRCKGLVDWYKPQVAIADTKTYGGGWSVREIANQAMTYGYDVSMAAYRSGIYQQGGYMLPVKMIYAATRPSRYGIYRVATYNFPDRELDRGLALFRKGLGLVHQAKIDTNLTDEWNEIELTLAYPEYAFMDGNAVEIEIGGTTETI